MENTEINLLKIQKVIKNDGNGETFLNDKLEYQEIRPKELHQVTKLGVTAPLEVEIKINQTNDFKMPDVNVLKYVPGTSNQIVDVCTFDENNELDFEPNNNVQFDGVMRLKTTFEQPMIKTGDFYETTINKSNLDISSISIV